MSSVMIAEEAALSLIAALGGKKNAVTLGAVVALIVAASSILTNLGAKWIWPGDRTSLLEIRMDHAYVRIDSTNRAMQVFQDTTSLRREDDIETRRAMLVLLCDRVTAQRLQDLKLTHKCRTAQDGP